MDVRVRDRTDIEEVDDKKVENENGEKKERIIPGGQRYWQSNPPVKTGWTVANLLGALGTTAGQDGNVLGGSGTQQAK